MSHLPIHFLHGLGGIPIAALLIINTLDLLHRAHDPIHFDWQLHSPQMSKVIQTFAASMFLFSLGMLYGASGLINPLPLEKAIVDGSILIGLFGALLFVRLIRKTTS